MTGSRTETVLVGCGAGFGGDRFDASRAIIAELAGRSEPRYLIFEVLAERTLAICQNLKRMDASAGYSPFLEMYLEPVLAECKSLGIRIVTNAGAANPLAAGQRILELARAKGIAGLRIGVVAGDDLLTSMSEDEIAAQTAFDDTPIGRPILAANAYLGSAAIVEALARGADIVLTGRCADAALTLGPLVHEYGWAADCWDSLASGTLAGHLLECGAQVSGATFADPGFKDAPGLSAAGLARLGYPIAEVARDGTVVIGKPAGTGGLVSEATVREQMLYELHDPANYVTPDVVLDITDVEVAQIAPDRVRVSGARGKPAPARLKVTVAFDGGWLGEAELSYAGINSLARARLAVDVLAERMSLLGIDAPYRTDIIGLSSVLDSDRGELRRKATADPDGDFRVRIATRARDRSMAQTVVREMLSLWAAGPAGGAGFRERLDPQVFTASVLVDRARVRPTVSML